MAVHPGLPVLHAHHDSRQEQARHRHASRLGILQATYSFHSAPYPADLPTDFIDIAVASQNSRATYHLGSQVTWKWPKRRKLRALHRRELREEVYRAFLTRASSGNIDNTPVINRILEARDEQAKLLGFSCYAEKSMASKARHPTSQMRSGSLLSLNGLQYPWQPCLHSWQQRANTKILSSLFFCW